MIIYLFIVKQRTTVLFSVGSLNRLIMVFCQEDALLIKNLYLSKGYGPVRLLSEFSVKGWKLAKKLKTKRC